MVRKTRKSIHVIVRFLIQISLYVIAIDKRCIIMKINLSMRCLFMKCVRLCRLFYSTLLNRYISNNTLCRARLSYLIST